MKKGPTPKFKLIFRDGRPSLELTDQVVSIGRQAESNVCLSDNGISRRHAQIVRDAEGWLLQDLGSANGTRVNGEPVKEHELSHRDVIAFDTVSARFEILVPTKPEAETEGRVVFGAASSAQSTTKTIDMQRFSRGTVLRSPMAQRGADWAVRLFSRAAQSLLSDLPLDDILERVMDLVFESVPADQGVLCLYDKESGESTPKVVRSAPGTGGNLNISSSIVNAALKDRSAVLVSDTHDDERFSANESIVASPKRTAMCAPLYHRGDALGFIYVSSRNPSYPFDGQCLEILTTLSVVSAVALEQTQLRENVEREQIIRSRLERYSSPHIVQKIVETSQALGTEMIAESTVVSVLFADIAGFTTFSEKMEPVEVTQILNSAFERFIEAVFSQDGTLDKFMGDGLMAIFGAPVAQPDHAAKAVRAAIMMHEQLKQLNESLTGMPPLAIRVGINSGPVIAGDIGSPTRRDYTVIGDTVNVASRLEASVAQPGHVVIGPETRRLLGDTISCESLGTVALKGRSQEVEAWLVESIES